MPTLIGYTKSEGEFNGFKYCNYILHVLNDDPPRDFVGDQTEVVKVKQSLFDTPPQIGDKLHFFYDRFRRVVEVRKED